MAQEVVVIGDEGAKTIVADDAADAQDRATEIETMDGPAKQDETTIEKTPAGGDEATPPTEDAGGEEPDESAAEIEVEPEEVEAAGDEDQPPEFPQALLDQASALGMSDDMIQTFPHPQLLEDAVRVMATAIGKQGRAAKERAEAPPEAEPQRREAPPERGAPALDEQQWKDAAAAFDAVDAEEHGELVAKAMQTSKTVMVAQQAQLGEMRGYVERLVGIVQDVRSHEDARELDGFVAALGDGVESIYGKGSYLEVDIGSAEFANRKKLATMVDDIATGKLDRGERLPPARVLYQLAHGALFGDKTATTERKKISAKLRKRQEAITPRGESERRAQPLGEKKALQALSEQMGVEPGDDDMAEFEESLGLK